MINFEQAFKGSFSFRNDNIRETQLEDGVHLRIERTGFAIAKVYFVDDNAAAISIPDGLVIHDDTNNANVARVDPNVAFFVLAWSDNYTITFNGVVVTELATQRQ